MTTSIRHGFNLTTGFDKAKHQCISLLSLGVPLSALAHARALLTVHGWEVLEDYHSKVLHNERVYDWVNIEAFAPAGGEVYFKILTLSTSLNYSPGIPVHNLTVVNFWQESTAGTISSLYFDNNKNYWTPVDGQLPFGISSDTPEAYTFIGLTGEALDRTLAVIVHTSPSIPIRNNLYITDDISIRTAGVAYLTPIDNDLWVYAINGESLLCLASKTKDLAGWTIPDVDVKYLLTQSMKYQFEVALVGRAWRNKYKAMSADIFKSIIRNPYHYAESMGYPLAETVAHFYK